MVDQILEAWRTHNAVNVYLLERISEAGFGALTLLKNGKPSNGRDVRRVFIHMLEVRIAKIPTSFRAEVPVFNKEAEISREDLIAAFEASSR